MRQDRPASGAVRPEQGEGVVHRPITGAMDREPAAVGREPGRGGAPATVVVETALLPGLEVVNPDVEVHAIAPVGGEGEQPAVPADSSEAVDEPRVTRHR